MKTTIELPDDLVRAVKLRAVREGRRMKDVMAEVIRQGLGQRPTATGRPVVLPLVRCAHKACPAEEMTPERVSALLLDEEASAVSERP
jgi:plasmid stability protein